jgi:hypothetical protein
MEGTQLAGAALFIGVFGFLAVGAWAGARYAERKAQARYALLTRLSEQPTDSARLVLEFLRKDEEEKALASADKTRRDHLMGGSALIAIGIGLAAFLNMIVPSDGPGRNVWTIGVMLVLLGVVLLGFGLYQKRPVTPRDRT